MIWIMVIMKSGSKLWNFSIPEERTYDACSSCVNLYNLWLYIFILLVFSLLFPFSSRFSTFAASALLCYLRHFCSTVFGFFPRRNYVLGVNMVRGC